MEKKCFVFIISVLLLIGSGAFAGNDNVGTSCANFLKMGVGPRAEAMGGAFVAMADDYTALYWNPAGIAKIGHNEAGISYTDWFLDIKHTFIGIVYNPGNLGTIGISVNYLQIGEMERTTPSEPDGTGTFFSPSDFAFGITYARNLTDRFSVGVKLKMIQETISFSSASTFGIDIGTHFVTGFRGLRLGMALSNFGGKMLMMGTDQMVKADADPGIKGNPDKDARLETEAWPIPMIFRIGVSMDVMKQEWARFTVNADFNDPRDVAVFGTFGGEFVFNNMVALRGGMRYTPDSIDETKLSNDGEVVNVYNFHMSFGGGILMQIPGSSLKMRLDYSYNENYLLENTNKFSFSLIF